MKRLVTFCIDEAGRKRVQSISAPISESDIDLELDTTIYGLIDADYIDPLPIEGKKMILYYNSDTQLIETEYTDIGYEDLNPQEKIAYLKNENTNLKAELELTQMALFELTELLIQLETPEEELPEEDIIEEEIPSEEIPSETPEEEPPVDETPVVPFNLVDAFENAVDGDTIVLPEDVFLDDVISVKSAITLDLNGYNITSNKSVFVLRSVNANLTIIGDGVVRAGSGGDYVAIQCTTGKLTINNGTYSVGPDANNAGNACIYASGSGEIYINGGEFSTDAAWSGHYFVLNKKDNSESKLIVTGGTFINFNPGANASEGAGTNFLAEGYEAIGNEDGTVFTVSKIIETTSDNVETETNINNEDVNSEASEVNSETSETISENTSIEENTVAE